MSIKGYLKTNNKDTKGRSVTKTHEGGKAYTLLDEEAIATSFTLGILGGNFYQSEEEMVKVLTEPLLKAAEDPELREFATKAAVYAAEEGGMKFMPVLWLTILSKVDLPLAKKVFGRIIRNPKLLHDLVTLARKADIRDGVGSGLKKVINKWLEARLTPYYATRYASRLEEIIRITRPKDTGNEHYDALLKYLFRPWDAEKKAYGPRRLTFPRAAALDSVLSDLREGKVTDETVAKINDYGFQLDELKSVLGKLSQEDKQRVLGAILPRLSYAATLSNLVTVERAFATQTRKVTKIRPNGQRYQQEVVIKTDVPDEIKQVVIDKITDFDAYKRTKMLPFGLITASEMSLTNEFKGAIDMTLRKSGGVAFEGLERSVLVACDVSYSMTSNIGDSVLTAEDVATVFGAMVAASAKNSRVVAVGTSAKDMTSRLKSEDLLKDADNIKRAVRDVGMGTNLHALFQHYKGEDVVLLITDGQQWGNVERYAKEHMKPGSIFIEWHVIGYHNRVAVGDRFAYITGYNDNILRLVRSLIEGGPSQVEQIKAVEL